MQRQIDLDRTRVMQINDPLIVRDLVIANGGLSFAPLLYCRTALASGALVQMYPHTRILRESSLSLLYPGHRLLPMKVHEGPAKDVTRACICAMCVPFGSTADAPFSFVSMLRTSGQET